jgi:low affinity Fe/Cu permease
MMPTERIAKRSGHSEFRGSCLPQQTAPGVDNMTNGTSHVLDCYNCGRAVAALNRPAKTRAGRKSKMPKRKTNSPQKNKGGDKNSSQKESGGLGKMFGDIANRTSQAAGRASTFMIAAGIVIVWAVTGPLFNYSDTWQLVINTGTTIITFLMVFLIQNSQNRDSAAIQVKLDELIRVSSAHNSFVGIEHLTDEELEDIRTKCERRAEAEKVGEASVEKTGQKARKAAERAVG